MKKLLALAFVGVAGVAPLGCERLFGVDFGDTPSRGDAGGALDDADVSEGGGGDGTLPDATIDGNDGAVVERCTEPCAAESWSEKAAVAIAVDDLNVYFAAPNTGLGASLQRCAKANNCKTPAKVTDTPDPVKLVESGGTLYWSTPTAIKSIVATANNGTSKELFEDTIGINTFAVGGGFLYPRRGDKIMRCALDAASCAPTDVVGGQGAAPSLVVTSSTSIVWGATLDSEVHTCDPANCGPTKRTLGGPYDRSPVDAKVDVAVWTMPGPTPTAGVYICAGKSCTARLLAASPKPVSPVTDGVDVYWGDTATRAIHRCRIGGCATASEHVQSQSLTTKDQVVVDGAGVYWTTSAGIRRAAK